MQYVNTVSKLYRHRRAATTAVVQKLFGSISHGASTALAVVSTHPVGLDIEAIFTQQTAVELADGIIDNHERPILHHSELPFPLALTLAFSAKESLYKAFSTRHPGYQGFTSAKLPHSRISN